MNYCSNEIVKFFQENEDLATTQKKVENQFAIHNLTLQPYVILCGPLNNVTASYAVVGKRKYCVASPLEAVDICYKSIKVFKSHYCKSCSLAWEFLGFNIYKCDSKSVNACVSSLIFDLKL